MVRQGNIVTVTALIIANYQIMTTTSEFQPSEETFQEQWQVETAPILATRSNTETCKEVANSSIDYVLDGPGSDCGSGRQYSDNYHSDNSK